MKARPFKKNIRSLGMLGYLITFGGCSLEVGNPKKDPDENVIKMTSDSETIQSQLDEVLGSTQNEASNNSDAALLLTESETNAVLSDFNLTSEHTATCTSTETNMEFIYSKQNETSQATVNRKGKEIIMQYSKTQDLKTTWTMPGANPNLFGCDTSNFPFIRIRKINNLTINKEFSVTSIRTAEVPADLQKRMVKSKTQTISGKHTTEQIRQVSAAETSFDLIRSTTFATSHSQNLVNYDGSNQNLLHSTTTPKAIKSVLHIENGIVTQRKIIEGTQLATSTDGTKLELVYSEIIFDQNEGCVPLSGKITGSLYESNGTTIRETISINFTDGKGTINYKTGGDSDEYIPDCKLFKP